MAFHTADFLCNECGEVHEIFYKTDDKVVCKACSSEDVVKLIGAPRIVDGVKALSRKTPDGFKDVLKHIDKTTPTNYKEAKFSAI